MAIIPKTLYPGQVDGTATETYPLGKARDITSPGDNTGTPYTADVVNDIWGLLQSLLSYANITADGNPDAVGASQYMDALAARLGSHQPHKLINCVAADVLIDWPQTLDTLAATSSALTFPRAACFDKDGSRLYIVEGNFRKVFQFDLPARFDITSAVYDYTLDLTATLSLNAWGMQWKPDGTSMFVSTSTTTNIFEFACTTPWDLSTASYASKSWDASTEMGVNNARCFQFTGEGTKLWWVCSDGLVYEYTLSTAWDLSTAAYASASYDLTTTGPDIPQLAVWSTDGRRLLGVGQDASDDLMYMQWNASTAYDLSTLSAVGSVTTVDLPAGAVFVPMATRDGARLLAGDQANDKLYSVIINRLCVSA